MTTPNFSRHYYDELPLYVAGHVSPEERAAIDRVDLERGRSVSE